MQYTKFIIRNYRAIGGKLELDLKNKILPLVGINECGKTTILQAVFAFDKANDLLNQSKHIQNIENLYALEDEECLIEAFIDISKKEFTDVLTLLKERLNDSLLKNKGKQETVSEDSEEYLELQKQIEDCEKKIILYSRCIDVIRIIDNDKINISIIRNLKESTYTLNFKGFNRLDDFCVISEEISETIVSKMPPILYSDDFNDRPAGEVELTKEGDSSEWERIYSRVFNNALGKNDFLIYNLIDEDTRRRKSTLSDVSRYLSDNLTDAWSRFSNEKKKITISFDLEERSDGLLEKKRYLLINIIENINGQERVFGVTDRSKGFIWYYNFIMKIQFNPKQNNNGNTVFLLDEPGSYLHETAQNELCKKLVEISKEEGNVIYCTHSPQLLNPSYIPLSTINIVSKRNSKICCSPISSYKTRSTQKTAFQPIYEALQIPEFKIIDKDSFIIAGEGIYDKYVIEMFCDLPRNATVFGSSNAQSLHDNIQYFIAFAIKYVAIWDNDNEGRSYYKQACKDFGNIESKKFHLLPNLHNKENVRMEEMFEIEDFEMINNVICLPINSSYTLTMSTLYYSEKKGVMLQEIKNKLTKKCSNNFANLSSTILKEFSSE